MTTRDEDEVSSDEEDSGKDSEELEITSSEDEDSPGIEDSSADELEACFLEDDEDFAFFEELERSILNHKPSIHR